MAEQDNPQRQAITIKVPDEIAGGVYANNMIVGHTKEEFLMDFIYMAPGQGIVTARVITSPGHMKRIIRALIENMQKYEARYGEIKVAKDPKEDVIIN
jgi:hypothetical protein